MHGVDRGVLLITIGYGAPLQPQEYSLSPLATPQRRKRSIVPMDLRLKQRDSSASRVQN